MTKRVMMMTWNKKTDLFALMCGHGKSLDGSWDSGCTYNGYTEAGLMLKITKETVKHLRASGIRVLTDADADNNRNMKSCVAWANTNKARFYMSIHCDYKLASAGVAPLYVSKKGKSMATKIGKRTAKLMNMKWKGAFKRTDLYELNAAKMPSVIFETGAIKADLKYLKDYKAYGKAFAESICKYFGVKFVPAKAESDKKPATTKKTNGDKIGEMANKLAYKTNTSKADYPKGSPTDAFKKALDKVYPNRKSWSAAPRKGASCDVFAGTVIRSTGIDEKFPRALEKQVPYLAKSNKFKRVYPDSVNELKNGDIIVYARPNKNGHICIFHDGKIKEASFQYCYGKTTNTAKSRLSKSGKKWIKVYRAK